jgi:hypothetical protein
MGVKVVALFAATAIVATSPVDGGVRYIQAHYVGDGGVAESGGAAYPQLTAWAVLGVSAANVKPSIASSRYFVNHAEELRSATDLALAIMAEVALAQDPSDLLVRLRALERPSGSVGRFVNGTAWAVLAFRAAGRAVPKRTIRWLLARQSRGGGWGWAPGAVDSNDSAAVVQALCAVGVSGPPIRRALRLLGRYRNRDGGFELILGRGSDAQSTAWVIQAFLAAGKRPPRGSLKYLRRLQRPDGSFRYSARYVTTPVWVTAQVLPALARQPFPLRFSRSSRSASSR